ncbi:hypothetical protein [Streptomyces sp. NBC_01334]|uniref:hypothetical protein n=1 Tax=Streptomyces sp. NBC_01334 TaxID=2903827 RepID=UPI002E167FB1|nr:hypothetical protein OG736_38085 [Streptomyces sp. NBC_01334]
MPREGDAREAVLHPLCEAGGPGNVGDTAGLVHLVEMGSQDAVLGAEVFRGIPEGLQEVFADPNTFPDAHHVAASGCDQCSELSVRVAGPADGLGTVSLVTGLPQELAELRRQLCVRGD